jgi:hypothetical protein
MATCMNPACGAPLGREGGVPFCGACIEKTCRELPAVRQELDRLTHDLLADLAAPPHVPHGEGCEEVEVQTADGRTVRLLQPRRPGRN